MKIIPLSEGSFTIDHSKIFVPFDTERESMEQRTKGSLLVEIQPFAVILDDSVVLLDAGLGYADAGGMMQIHRNLSESGLSPGDVDAVLLTHLHKDHSGGLVMQDPLTGSVLPAFPNARYFVQRAEFEEAFAKGGSSYDTGRLETLRTDDRLVLLDGEGWLAGSIRYMPSGGHSPHHQVFWIVSRGETLFFGGDEAPQLQQMRFPYVAKYDFDGRRAREWRREWWQKGREEGWTFLFYHDVKSPIFRESISHG
jgi:glyoxylase-like metal-dependent hydrolase (beta-lactamase superfamily II)